MITFYTTLDAYSIRPYIPPVPVLLPASSWAKFGLRNPNLPPHLTEKGGDCGGFVATFKWGGVYPYSPDQLVTWYGYFGPQWAAMMDLCCEPEITGGKSDIVRERQQRTTHNAWHFWQYYYDCPWTWTPTVQGWEIDDYRRHAAELRPLVEQMQHYYGLAGQLATFRVGIGTLCRRASVEMIRAVVQAVAAELPGVALHLWGVKLGALQSGIYLGDQVASVDSAAWNGNQQIERAAWEASGLSRRQYVFTVALPVYLAKVAAATAAPKQGVLL